jgi:hypothetical protein
VQGFLFNTFYKMPTARKIGGGGGIHIFYKLQSITFKNPALVSTEIERRLAPFKLSK